MHGPDLICIAALLASISLITVLACAAESLRPLSPKVRK
jgi:hypothetical protein